VARPERALGRGGWVKLIGGASNQDVVALEDIAAIYTLAGVHCIDVAADTAVVAAVRRGIAWARRRGASRPWLMVSLSDGDDPHFRKAWFDPLRCPADCPRPCERVCPVEAIGAAGVVTERCYGCGRCLPACPLGRIVERPRLLPPAEVPSLLSRLAPDAVELHTRIGRAGPFAARLQQLLAAGVRWRWLAVSCGLETDAALPVGPEALAGDLWQRFVLLRRAGLRPLWQLDGRPMSGDLGAGTAHAALRLLQQVGPLAPPGPLQLAGGTNEHTLPALRRLAGGVPPVAGVAFGGVARQRLQPLLRQAERRGRRLRDEPDLRRRALALARELVDPWRRRGAPASG
jgi:Fe-S-cluster-containing hydrogenase component 2